MKILICDDNIEIVESISMLLEDSFASVSIVKIYNGYDALRRSLHLMKDWI